MAQPSLGSGKERLRRHLKPEEVWLTYYQAFEPIDPNTVARILKDNLDTPIEGLRQILKFLEAAHEPQESAPRSS